MSIPRAGGGNALTVRRFLLGASFANLAPFGVSAATTQGRLCLGFGHMRPLIGRHRAGVLADEMLSTLRLAIRDK